MYVLLNALFELMVVAWCTLVSQYEAVVSGEAHKHFEAFYKRIDKETDII